MRKCFLAVLLGIALSIGAAATASAPLATMAQCAVPVTPQIAAILAQSPTGGPGLRAAIARLVEADPSLAAAVVAASNCANPAQQAAIGAGLGDATDFFAKIASGFARHAAEMIRAAIVYANPIVLANYTAAASVSDSQVIPGTNNNAGNTASACISPSRPGRGC